MGTKDMIKIMQAYADGKEIQVALKDYNVWENPLYMGIPLWNWEKYKYRIKPEPKYRPLKPEELITLKGKWLKCKEGGNIFLPTGITDKRVLLGGNFYYADRLLSNWTYEDGSPVGVLEEE